MTSSQRRKRAFTLLEVLGAVLILGLVYTVMARVAMVGLRSEGIDRRRAEASLLADYELATLESVLLSEPLRVGATNREEDIFRIAVAVELQDVMELIPAAVSAALQEGDDGELTSLLVDDRGDSRIQRIRVAVEWDEGLDTVRVERLSYAFDTSELAALFPAEEEAGDDEEGDAADLSPEAAQDALLEQMRQQLDIPQ